jgi:hypothetical protein
LNGDGLCDDRDLFALGGALVGAGAGQAVLDSYQSLLLHRGDVDASGTTNAADVGALYAHFGSHDWLSDINSDGVVNSADVLSLVTQVFRSAMGDFNLDGIVDNSDYLLWKSHYGSGSLFTEGDANLDGHVDAADYTIWREYLGFHVPALAAGAGSQTAVPEPTSIGLLGWCMAWIVGFLGRRRGARSQATIVHDARAFNCTN